MYYHANNPAGGARSPSAPVSEKRFIKMGHTCFGVSDGSSLTLTGADRHDSLVWSRKTESPTGTAHSWSPYGSGRPSAPLLPGFNGERIDPVSGSYHLGNGYRAYNPVLMRFNCPDSLSPFGAGGINPYAYCAGDPVNHTDPSGHISFQGIFGIMLGVIGLGFTIASGGVAIAAAGTVAAAFSSVSTTALVVGGLGIVADVTAIASGAIEASSPEASSILGWVSLATGIAGFVMATKLPRLIAKRPSMYRSYSNERLASLGKTSRYKDTARFYNRQKPVLFADRYARGEFYKNTSIVSGQKIRAKPVKTEFHIADEFGNYQEPKRANLLTHNEESFHLATHNSPVPSKLAEQLDDTLHNLSIEPLNYNKIYRLYYHDYE